MLQLAAPLAPSLALASMPAIDAGAVMLANSTLPALSPSIVGDIINEITSTFFGAPTGAIGAGGQMLLDLGLQVAAPFVALALVFKGVKMSFGIK